MKNPAHYCKFEFNMNQRDFYNIQTKSGMKIKIHEDERNDLFSYVADGIQKDLSEEFENIEIKKSTPFTTYTGFKFINTFRNLKVVLKENVQYQLKTKPEYLRSLKQVFTNDSFIKFEFTNLKIERHKVKRFYGVTIQQLWYAENYWDEGRLFLLFEYDDKAPEQFILHVRAWELDINLDDVEIINTEIDTMHYDYLRLEY